MKIYYARPITMIGSTEDKANLAAIKEKYPGATITKASEQGCTLKKKNMNVYFRMVDRADLVVIAQSAPNTVSSGVLAEAQHGAHRNKPIHLIKQKKAGAEITPVKSFDTTKVKKKDPATRWAKVILKPARKKP